MQKVAKILALPPQKSGNHDILDSLAEHNISRWGTSAAGLPPKKLRSGKYATGLDENADYIKKMAYDGDEQGALREAEIVKARRIRLERSTGYDLSPTSEYYSGVYGAKYNQPGVAKKIRLSNSNVFNFENPEEEITFWWASQLDHLVAPSMGLWRSGKCGDKVQYYVENPEAEIAVKYNQVIGKADAVSTIKTMEEKRLKKVAKLCGLPVTENDSYQTVFTLIYEMIDKGKITEGEYKGQDAVALFTRIANLSDKVLNVRNLVREALLLRVYTKRNSVVYEGEMVVAPTEESLVTQLSMDEHYMQHQALEIKVNDRRKMKSTMINFDYSSLPDLMPENHIPQENLALIDNEQTAQTAFAQVSTEVASDDRIKKMNEAKAANKLKKEQDAAKQDS